MASLPTSQTTPKRQPSKMNSQAVNVNHLLNFTLPPRVQPMPSTPRRSKKTSTQQGIWNKERFVNAQYRFVMQPMGDYTVHFADPDIFFQWTDIAQVIIPRASAFASAGEDGIHAEGHTNCPICLSPPTASRMTKCGHIFCYPCILHYLTTSDKGWARCPICFDSITDKQLKNVKWSTFDDASSGAEFSSTESLDTPRAGSLLRMRLMQRPQITTMALPRSHTWPSDLILPHQAPFHFLPDIFNYSKFMLATPDYLLNDLSRDLDELEAERRSLARMNDDLGVSFIDAAGQKIRNYMTRVTEMDTPELRGQITKARQSLRELENRHARSQQQARDAPVEEVPEEFLALHSVASPPSRPSSVTRNAPKQRRNLNPPPPSTSTYYFYQAASGLPIFLHPLDIKILLSHFSNYPSFPDVVDVRIEALSEGTVNDDLRKRCKYLAHLPEGADVVFIEADLTNVVGPDGLKNFEGPLKMRTSRRKEKGRRDDRAKARADERERERLLLNEATWTAPVSTPVVVPVEPDSPAHEGVPLPPSEPISGAWGSRSFASTLSNPGTPGRGQRRVQAEEDEWDIDAAWHELESRNTSATGGRRKKSNKLVLIGGGGAPRRR